MNENLINLGSAAENLSRYIAQHGDSASIQIIRAQVELIVHRAETAIGVSILK